MSFVQRIFDTEYQRLHAAMASILPRFDLEDDERKLLEKVRADMVEATHKIIDFPLVDLKKIAGLVGRHQFLCSNVRSRGLHDASVWQSLWYILSGGVVWSRLERKINTALSEPIAWENNKAPNDYSLCLEWCLAMFSVTFDSGDYEHGERAIYNHPDLNAELSRIHGLRPRPAEDAGDRITMRILRIVWIDLLLGGESVIQSST